MNPHKKLEEEKNIDSINQSSLYEVEKLDNDSKQANRVTSQESRDFPNDRSYSIEDQKKYHSENSFSKENDIEKVDIQINPDVQMEKVSNKTNNSKAKSTVTNPQRDNTMLKETIRDSFVRYI